MIVMSWAGTKTEWDWLRILAKTFSGKYATQLIKMAF
jgi:hypothetical protein